MLRTTTLAALLLMVPSMAQARYVHMAEARAGAERLGRAEQRDSHGDILGFEVLRCTRHSGHSVTCRLWEDYPDEKWGSVIVPGQTWLVDVRGKHLRKPHACIRFQRGRLGCPDAWYEPHGT